MSYSVFRVQGIKTTGALRGIGKHDKDRISTTNPDINKKKSNDNIELIKCDGSYLDKFNAITSKMRKEHDERMQTMRADRVTSFEKSLNTSKSDVACEMIFTSDESFFKSMDRKDIVKWAKTSLDFVTEAIGIKSSNIIHAVVHMDEKTPHLHVVAIPLIRSYDGRRKKEVLKISRAKYIPDRLALSQLQDRYNDRLKANGYDLDRGNVGGKAKHRDTIDFKNEELNKLNIKIHNANKIMNKHIKTVSDSKTLINNIDEIGFKPTFMDKNKVIIDKSDFKRLKELSKVSLISSNKVQDLQKNYKKLSGNFNVVKAQMNKYADENINLEKQVKAYTKNIETLLEQRKVLVDVLRENNLVGKAEERIKEINPREKKRTLKKSKNFNMER